MNKRNRFSLRALGFDILKAWIEVIMLSLILCTITFLFASVPACYLWVAAQLIFAAVGVVLAHILPGLGVVQIILGTAATLGGTYLLHLRLGTHPALAFFMGACAVGFTLRGRLLTLKVWDKASPVSFYRLCIRYTLLFTLFVSIIPRMEAFRPVATGLGAVIVAVDLLALNARNVYALTDVERNTTSNGAMELSGSFRRIGRGVRVILFAAVGLLSLATPLYGTLRFLLGRVRSWIDTFDFPAWQIALPKQDLDGLIVDAGELEIHSPGLNSPLLMYIVNIIAGVTIAAIACYLLWFFYGVLREFIRFLRSHDWSRRRVETLAEYDDTIESLIDLRDLPKAYVERAKGWVNAHLRREPAWEELKTNAEKARALYRRVLARARDGGYTADPAATPTETLRGVEPHVELSGKRLDVLRDCYETARYGEREPDGETVEALNREI